jgi:hypothetical protein
MRFRLDDGVVQELLFGIEGDNQGLLRGDPDAFQGRDIRLSTGSGALIETLLESAP